MARSVVLSCVLLFAFGKAAQTRITTSEIYGRVKDESGGAVLGATVLLAGDVIGGLCARGSGAGGH